jgi:hypothetical protein
MQVSQTWTVSLDCKPSTNYLLCLVVLEVAATAHVQVARPMLCAWLPVHGALLSCVELLPALSQLTSRAVVSPAVNSEVWPLKAGCGCHCGPVTL